MSNLGLPVGLPPLQPRAGPLLRAVLLRRGAAGRHFRDRDRIVGVRAARLVAVLGDGHRQHPSDALGGGNPGPAGAARRTAPAPPRRRRHRPHEPGGARAVRGRLRARGRRAAGSRGSPSSLQSGLDREAFLAAAAALPGFYVPAVQGPRAESAESARVVVQQPMSRKEITPEFEVPHTTILTPRTELSDKLLIEISRGCTEMCRFCWAAYAMAPVKQYPASSHPESRPGGPRADGSHGAHRDRRLRPSRDHPDPRGSRRPRVPHRALLHQDRRDRGSDPRDPRAAGRTGSRDRAGSRQRAPAPLHQQEGLRPDAPREVPAGLRARFHAAQALPAGRAPVRDRGGRARHRSAGRRSCTRSRSRRAGAPAGSPRSSRRSTRSSRSPTRPTRTSRCATRSRSRKSSGSCSAS